MENKKYTLLLSAIGVPYSVSGKIDNNVLPEKALCTASPLFHEDAKACSLVYSLLKNNYDLFVDAILTTELKKQKDTLAIAILGGILYKSSKNHFKKSVDMCVELTTGKKILEVKKPLRLLADFGQASYDLDLLSLYGLKMNAIEAVDIKKTLPRETIISRNSYFSARSSGSYINKTSIKSAFNSYDVDITVTIKNSLCDKLIDIIKRNELKQFEVATLINATPAQVSEIMTKKMNRVSVDFLVQKSQLLVDGLKSNNIADEKVDIDLSIRPSVEI